MRCCNLFSLLVTYWVRWLQLHEQELPKLGNASEALERQTCKLRSFTRCGQAWVHLGIGPDLLVKQ